MIVKCKVCNKERYEKPARINLGRGKYCSFICYWEDLRGKQPKNTEGLKKGRGLMKGKRITKITGDKNPAWKGQEVSLSGLHKWVARFRGKPDTCEFCGVTGLNGHKINWANKSHQYKRDLDDWFRLCIICHRKYDKKDENYATTG